MEKSTGNRYAVVIGIDSYQDQNIPKLRCARKDAEAIHRFLINQAQGGFSKENVLCLLNEDATLTNLKSALGGIFLPRRTQPSDTVVIYWSGHGCPDVSVGADKVTKYLIPYDARIDDLYSTAFPMEEMNTVFNKIKAERVVLFVDACFSGLAGGRTFMGPGFRGAGLLLGAECIENISGSGRIIVSACGANELAKEDHTQGHGVFTKVLLEGLAGKADLDRDGYVEITELYSYLTQNVPSRAQMIGGHQTPMWNGEIKGPIYLSRAVTEESKRIEPKEPKAPIMAFFGAKGGVGKTTITNLVADLAAVAPKGPNVLIIDMDVHAMGTTVHRTRGHFTCRTIHQHMIQKDSIRPDDVEAEDVTDTISRPAVIQDNRPGGLVGDPENWGKGRVYVIPSSTREDYNAFDEQAAVSNAQVKQNLDAVIKFAVKKYNISLVLIDCTAIIDRYTAAAARAVSENAVIIRDPNPECQLFLEVVRPRLQAFFPDFDGGKLYTVMNKAGSTVTGAGQYFAIVPFTTALIDSTVFVDATEVQLMLFHADILEMMKRAFKDKYPDLIPEDKVVLPKSWMELVKRAPELLKSLRLRLPLLLMGVGGVAVVAWAGVRYGLDVDASALGVLLAAGIVSIIGGGWLFRHFKDHRKHLNGLVREREKWLIRELRHITGQEVLSELRKWLRVKV